MSLCVFIIFAGLFLFLFILKQAIEKGLREVIDTLDETNKTIVSKLELGFTCEEIAHEMGVSRQAIHQRVQNIRKIIDNKWLKFA